MFLMTKIYQNAIVCDHFSSALKSPERLRKLVTLISTNQHTFPQKINNSHWPLLKVSREISHQHVTFLEHLLFRKLNADRCFNSNKLRYSQQPRKLENFAVSDRLSNDTFVHHSVLVQLPFRRKKTCLIILQPIISRIYITSQRFNQKYVKFEICSNT